MLLVAPMAGAGADDAGPRVYEADVCVYGGTSGGVVAAVQAARMGKTVVLVDAGRHLGGMSSGGLCFSDMGNKAAVGGLARGFYRRVGARYGVLEETRLEPHVAELVFDDMVREAGVPVYRGREIATVKKQGARIVAIGTEGGDTFAAKVFIDATYEGDLMARAGVSYTVVREANARYGETLNGIQLWENPKTEWGAYRPNGRRQDGRGVWDRAIPLDPYVVPGKPETGLLPLVQAGALGRIGDEAPGVQAYCYRLCVTTRASNRITIEPPPGYDPARYELVARYIKACQDANDALDLRWFTKYDPLPNEKFDLNTAYFGLNDDNENLRYPEAGPAERNAIRKEHENYARGLLHFLTTDARVPENIRTELSRYGLCKDEFVDNGGWPHQLYVREARRMVSDMVMTEHHCRGTQAAPNPIGLASYGIDIHEVRRIAHNGLVVREGKLLGHSGTKGPYPVGYGTIVPRKTEADNLLVPFCLSASHVAFGSIRMEPVFMILSQSAATAAALAIDNRVPVQEVDQDALRARLLADDQVLAWPASALDRSRSKTSKNPTKGQRE